MAHHSAARAADTAAGQLDHGVAPVQRVLRGERADLRLQVAQRSAARGDGRGDGCVDPRREPVMSSARAVTMPAGAASTGRVRSAASRSDSRATSASTRAAQLARRPDPGEFLRDVRDDPLGRIRGCGRPQVRHVVEQGPVGLMADGADNRRGRSGTARIKFLAAEGQQVLQRPAAAGNDDDVDVGAGVEFRERPMTWDTALTPWTATSRTSNSTAGQRSEAFRMTSFLASESRPVMRPIRCGSSGRRFLRDSSKRPSAASACRSRSIRASRSPRPTGRMSLTACSAGRSSARIRP